MGLLDALLPLGLQGRHVDAQGLRRLKRKEIARGDKPVARKLFIQLDPQLVKYEEGRLRISIRPYRFITIRLKFGDYQRKFINE